MARKLDPYEWDIADKLEDGWTYKKIQEWLLQEKGLNVTQATICDFVKRQGLTSLNTIYPICSKCPDYREVGVNHLTSKQDRKRPVRVCMACLEVIPDKIKRSPNWCSQRRENAKRMYCD